MIYRLILLSVLWCSTAHALVFGPIMASSTTYAPSAPVSVSGAAGNGQVVVSWSAGTVDGTHSAATSFNLWRGTSSGGTSPWQSGVTSPYTDTASNGTGYYYKVEAVNSAGNTLSTVAGPYTPSTGVPSAPTGHSTVAGNASITLHPGTASGATSYKYYLRATSDPTTSTYDATGTATDGQVISSLTNGTTYKVGYTAVNGSGESVLSTIDSATPSAPSYATLYDFTGAAGAYTNSFFSKTAGGSGTIQLDGIGHLVLTSPATTDSFSMMKSSLVSYNTGHTYAVKFRIPTQTITNMTMRGLSVVNTSTSSATVGTDTTMNGNSISVVGSQFQDSGSGLKMTIQYYNLSALGTQWDTSSNSWKTSGAVPLSLSYDTDYVMEIVTTSTGFQYNVYSGDKSSTLVSTTSAGSGQLWSSVKLDTYSNFTVNLVEDWYTNYWRGQASLTYYGEN